MREPAAAAWAERRRVRMKVEIVGFLHGSLWGFGAVLLGISGGVRGKPGRNRPPVNRLLPEDRGLLTSGAGE